MWGIQVGRIDTAPVIKGFLDRDEEDDITASTDTLTTLAGDWNNSESDEDDDAEELVIESKLRPPPAELMYGGQGKCEEPARVIVVPDARPVMPTKKRKRRDKRGGRKGRRRTNAFDQGPPRGGGNPAESQAIFPLNKSRSGWQEARMYSVNQGPPRGGGNPAES